MISSIVTRLRVFTLMGFHNKVGSAIHRTFIAKVPLRSPMSIFSKSLDLEKCAVVTGL